MITKSQKHDGLCNQKHHAMRDEASGYKTYCDGNRNWTGNYRQDLTRYAASLTTPSGNSWGALTKEAL